MELNAHDALLVVDLQKDFLPGGALGIPGGDALIGPINHVIRVFESKRLPVFASRDWHPADHISFKARGGPWPPHCVQGTEGAAFSPDLRLPPGAILVSKATHRDIEAYSCFQEGDLAERMKAMGIRRIFIGGLATEYCVLNSTRDATRAGFEVYILEDAIQGINQDLEEVRKVKDEIRSCGARFIQTSQLAEAGAKAA